MTLSGFAKFLNCVVLIDDDSINNYINQLTLKSLNITDNVVVLKNGNEGLEFLQKCFEEKKNFPELIFIDINMPVINGFEFLERFNQMKFSQSKPTFAVLTTSSDSRDMSRLEGLGIKYFFNKPLTKEKLSGLLYNIFGNSIVPLDEDVNEDRRI